AGGEHRDPHPGGDPRMGHDLLGQPGRLGPEQQHVLAGVVDVVEGHVGVGREGEDPRLRHRGESGVDVRVEADVGQVVIVQPGTAELGVLEVEAERLDEVEVGTGDGGQPYRV